jgi:glycosyltransferase involved in cell wall biosynthesis
MNNQIFIIIPCYNESLSIEKLLNEIDDAIKNSGEKITVVIVDDGSTDSTSEKISSFKFKAQAELKILRLEYNTGHQSALEQGILYAHSYNADFVITMDGDGEDDPSLIQEILKNKNFDIVFATRGKRGESLGFKFGYLIYQFIFYFISGKKINFGNFCMINSKVIQIIHERSFIHLASFVSKLNLNSTTIKSDRRPRISGNSKMKFSDLVHHAFKSFIEYAEEFVMLFLKLFVVLFVLFIAMMIYIGYLKLFTDKAILGWASTLGIGFMTSALLCIGFFSIGILLLNQSNRKNKSLPRVVYKIFI